MSEIWFQQFQIVEKIYRSVCSDKVAERFVCGCVKVAGLDGCPIKFFEHTFTHEDSHLIVISFVHSAITNLNLPVLFMCNGICIH